MPGILRRRALPKTLPIRWGNMYSTHNITFPGMNKIHHHAGRPLTLLLSTSGIAASASLSKTFLRLPPPQPDMTSPSISNKQEPAIYPSNLRRFGVPGKGGSPAPNRILSFNFDRERLARISHRAPARCVWRGLNHFRAYVWSSVVAYNLALFVRLMPT